MQHQEQTADMRVEALWWSDLPKCGIILLLLIGKR